MNIYSPLEVQSRELEARILFCIQCAEKGHNSFFGQNFFFSSIIKNLQPGIFIHKSLQKRKYETLKYYSRLGHLNISFDEEALMIFDEEEYFAYRLLERNLKVVDFFVTWGKKDFNMIKNRYENIEEKLICAGNSRIDVLKKQLSIDKKASSIKEKYGDFILVNTKFSRFNVKDRGMGSFADMCKYNNPNLSNRVFKKIQNSVEFEEMNLNKYMETIIQLASDFKEIKIIIRPHPAENHKTWEIFLKNNDLENVFLVFDGLSANPWMKAAYKVISYNCTTSLEAALMGVNSINYIPIENTELEYEIPKKCSVTIRTYQGLKEEIKNKNLDIKDLKELDYFIQNSFSHDFAYFLLSKLEQLIDVEGYSNNNKFYSFSKLIFFKIYLYLRQQYSLYFGNTRKRRNLLKQKCPGFSLKDVKSIAKSFNVSKNIKIEEAWPGIFSFRKV